VKRYNMLLVAKEALHNVVKHASASSVCIRFRLVKLTIEVEIEDDGCGFRTGNAKLLRRGNGLENMQRRAKDIEGQLSVESLSGGGTRIRLIVPIGINVLD
jgi:signal transduction histidine kinase